MPRKAVIFVAVVTAFAAAGCASSRKPTAPVAPPPLPPPAPAAHAGPHPASPGRPAARPSPEHHAPQPVTRPKTPTAPASPSATNSALPSLIGAKTSWVDYGHSLVVARDNTPGVPAVPLFRQAIVLASVRAAVAGSPTVPVAEFRRGLLTLTFPRGTPQEIASAVNRAIAVPEVTKLGVQLSN